MPTAPRQSQKTSQIRPPGDSAPELSWRPGDLDSRSALARAIPRRRGVSWWLGIVLALGFAALVTPAITAEHWLLHFDTGTIAEKHAAPFTVRAPMTGYGNLRIGGGVVVARGEIATRDEAAIADAIAQATPRGPLRYAAFFALTFVLAALFTHHMRRSNKGRLLRVQIVSLAVIAVLAAVMKAMLLITALSALVVPLAVLAMVPTIALDRIVGLATGVLAALVICLLAPFDIGLALLLLVQAATAGLVIAEAPRRRWLAALTTGLVTTACTSATYLLLSYLTSGHAPELRDPLHSPWLAAGIGPALAALLTPPMIPIYQLLVGEITQSKLFALEDLGHPLLRQIAEKAPGTWQHSLMMANMAEIAANAIGANGRLVRVGAYFHDLGKSLSPRYFIENLEAGETSPHDLLPPEVSCDAIFGHVTEGIVAARKAGLHERIVDFMHMHHGNGVLEYFWARCREQGNPQDFTIERFRYPGHPPQSRETALLAICDAVEAASRTLQKPDAAAIDSLVQRIVYGKLHLGQLDESGLSMSDLRRISDSLRETIRHANHGRIEYPWQKAGQDASASVMTFGTSPRLDSLDRKPVRDSARVAPASDSFGGDAALAVTADVQDPAEASGPGQRFAGGSRPETSDAARIRAGTARNAQPSQAAATPEPAAAPSEPAPSAGASLGLFDVDGRDAVPTAISGAGSGSDPRSSRPVRPQAVLVSDPAITLPGRAPGPAPDVEADAARSVERSAGLGAPGSAAHPAPRREPAITLTGRAPGPAPAPAPISDPQLERSAAPDAEIGRDAAGTLPGRAPGPAPAPSATGGMRASEPSAGDVDAAQPPRRARTSPAPHPPPGARPVEPARSAGPPRPVDLDNATTNPPPLRRGPGGQPAMPADPAQLATALADLVSRVADAPFGKPGDSDAAVTQPTLPAVHTGEPQRTSGLADESRNQLVTLRGYGDDASTSRRPVADRAALDDARVTVPRAATAPPDEPARPPDVPAAHEPDAGITEPSLPMLAIGDQRRVDMPLTPPRSEADRTRWAQGLAARIDAALTDEWGNETPIVPPTKAELRALLGQPDPTKQQPIDELELLQRRASELSDPAMPRRAPHPTAEVDPDDIEAAIELAPPARRGTHPHAIGATKPRKPE